MNSRAKILKALAIQAQIEGQTENITLLEKIVGTVKYSSEFDAFVTVRQHRYGKLSYETHHFYYIKDYMKQMLRGAN